MAQASRRTCVTDRTQRRHKRKRSAYHGHTKRTFAQTRMNALQYVVIVQEHDSTEWDDGHLFSRAGAWARVQSLARLVVDGWPHPVFCRVYVMRKDEKHLVWSGDLRKVQ